MSICAACGECPYECRCYECLQCPKLEAELKAMDEARLAAAAVIVGYQEKFSKQESERDRLREALERIKTDIPVTYEVHQIAKAALEEEKRK